MMRPSTIQLFQRCLHAWTALYLLSALPAHGPLWTAPYSPLLGAPPGPFKYLTHAFSIWLPSALALPLAIVLLVLAIYGCLRQLPTWGRVLLWMGFMSLMDLSWLTATGGHHLMANALFWSVFLGLKSDAFPAATLRLAAFWIVRTQLLVAYATTAILKLSGQLWVHGQAVGVVASDPSYGPAFLSAHPGVSMMLNYGVVLFQIGFPLAMAFSATRRLWMCFGVVFHLATFSFGIPDMALAFLAIYPIWSSEQQAERWLAHLRPR